MIISHRHRYVFVEVPRTGSTAVSAELRENYDGHEILRKHASYRDFLRVASEEERGYFTFSAVRNPPCRVGLRAVHGAVGIHVPSVLGRRPSASLEPVAVPSWHMPPGASTGRTSATPTTSGAGRGGALPIPRQ
jgi:hypothetical protein